MHSLTTDEYAMEQPEPEEGEPKVQAMELHELGKIQHNFETDKAFLFPNPEGHRLLTLSKKDKRVYLFVIKGQIKDLKHHKQDRVVTCYPKMERYSMARKKLIQLANIPRHLDFFQNKFVVIYEE